VEEVDFRPELLCELQSEAPGMVGVFRKIVGNRIRRIGTMTPSFLREAPGDQGMRPHPSPPGRCARRRSARTCVNGLLMKAAAPSASARL